MPIEINGQSSPPAPNTGNGAPLRTVQHEPGNGAPRQAEGAPAQDSVSLTGAAALMHKLDQQISDLPVVDQQRVEGIRESILNGAFSIDSMRVAEKLIASETALQVRNGG